MDAKELLDAYRQLWFNRALLVGKNEYLKLIGASVEKELKDEMTHPRLRKSSYEKFHMAVKRIISSDLNDNQKVKLIDLHSNVLESLEKKS